MKKINIKFKLAAVIMLFISCSASKKSHNYKKSIEGNWQLQTIVSEGVTDNIKTKVFNEANFNCFVGSSWSFNPGNNFGTYSISKNAKECAELKRNISWSVIDLTGQQKQLLFKRLDNTLKVVDKNNEEFRFIIIQLNKKTMQLRSETTFDGQPASFIYNFVRG